MKLKAKDTFSVSSVQAEALRPGDEFETDAAEGKALVDRGLASEVKAPVAKDDPKPTKARTKQAKG